jgi:hypothetical protein
MPIAVVGADRYDHRFSLKPIHPLTMQGTSGSMMWHFHYPGQETIRDVQQFIQGILFRVGRQQK